MALRPLFNVIFLGLGWTWVGGFVGFMIVFTHFPTQQNKVDRKNRNVADDGKGVANISNNQTKPYGKDSTRPSPSPPFPPCFWTKSALKFVCVLCLAFYAVGAMLEVYTYFEVY